jgi:hypothetical protein
VTALFARENLEQARNQIINSVGAQSYSVGAYRYVRLHTYTKQAMYLNRNIRRVIVTIFAVEKQWVLYILIVCLQLTFVACNAHGPYYIFVCGLFGCSLLFHIFS